MHWSEARPLELARLNSILALPLINCVTLGKLVNLSVLYLP